MTNVEANDILNSFAGWEPGRKCPEHDMCHHGFCSHDQAFGDHEIQPTDYFADTPEAREAVRLIKDAFVRRTKLGIEIRVQEVEGAAQFSAHIFNLPDWDVAVASRWGQAIEHHAIALAIAEALKERP